MSYCSLKANIGIVILHYMAFEMTRECIECIQHTFHENCQIVIVDNASSNCSGKELAKIYKDSPNIKVIINDENVGFSRGNNIGYQYLKNNFNLDFIIVANNDVLIRQNDFKEVVKSIYIKEEFDILGPDIYNPKTKIHQNPSRTHGFGLEEVRRLVTIYEKQDRSFPATYLKMKICDLRDFFCRRTNDNYSWKKQMYNPVLHGACYIFSKKFINKNNYAFYPETFLYVEEDILFYRCKVNDYKVIYSPELMVEHLEDVSTDMIFTKEYKKRKMKNHEMLLSYRVLLNLMGG